MPFLLSFFFFLGGCEDDWVLVRDEYWMRRNETCSGNLRRMDQGTFVWLLNHEINVKSGCLESDFRREFPPMDLWVPPST